MGFYVARLPVKLLIQAGKPVHGVEVLVLGATFKENVRDVRNSRVVELVRELESFGIEVSLYEAMSDFGELQQWGLRTIADPFEANRRYDVLVLAVPHQAFRQKGLDAYLRLLRTNGARLLVDVKGVLSREAAHNAGIVYWSL